MSVTSRLETATDVLRRIADAGGGLWFRTRQEGTTILFEVYQPADLSGRVRFSFDLGNLKYVGYTIDAPKIIAAIVGGQGTGADRYLIERVDEASVAAWGRVETLVSRPGSDPLADLQAAGDEALNHQGHGGRDPLRPGQLRRGARRRRLAYGVPQAGGAPIQQGSVAGGSGEPWSAGYYHTAPDTLQAFGWLDIVDSGTTITVHYQGITSLDGITRVEMTTTFEAANSLPAVWGIHL